MALSPEQMMALLVERAPALRAAGVTSLTLGDMRVSFGAAPEQSPPFEAPRSGPAEVTEHPDPLQDPDTFGGEVPSFPKDADEDVA